jgi:hypothetical protein
MGAVLAAGALGKLGGAYIQGRAAENVAKRQEDMSKYATDIGAERAKEELEYTKAVYGENSDAYRQAYQKALAAIQSGEKGLEGGYESAIEQAGQTPEEILNLKKDIETGNTRTLEQGRNQLAAALATGGVRGGQAATQLRRGIGEQTQAATEDINRLMANVATQSKAYQQALLNQQLVGKEGSQAAKERFVYNPESAKFANQSQDFEKIKGLQPQAMENLKNMQLQPQIQRKGIYAYGVKNR